MKVKISRSTVTFLFFSHLKNPVAQPITTYCTLRWCVCVRRMYDGWYYNGASRKARLLETPLNINNGQKLFLQSDDWYYNSCESHTLFSFLFTTWLSITRAAKRWHTHYLEDFFFLTMATGVKGKGSFSIDPDSLSSEQKKELITRNLQVFLRVMMTSGHYYSSCRKWLERMSLMGCWRRGEVCVSTGALPPQVGPMWPTMWESPR